MSGVGASAAGGYLVARRPIVGAVARQALARVSFGATADPRLPLCFDETD